jgi:hypothetical protein
MRAMHRGELPMPPISSLIGMEAVSAEEGEVVFSCTPAEWMYNPIGSVHGGIALTLLDSAMGCAVHTTCEAGTGYTSLEVSTSSAGSPRGPGCCTPRAPSSTAGGGWPPPRGGSPRRPVAACWRTQAPPA